MTRADYSGDNADYSQIYAIHTKPLIDQIFEKTNFDSIDAVVLEAYHSERWFEKFWKSELKRHHSPVLQNAQRTGKPIYIVDVLTTSGGRSFEELATLPLDLLGIFGAIDGATKARRQLIENKEMTRRQLLKFWTGQTIKFTLGSYFGARLLIQNYAIQTGDLPEPMARVNSSRTHLVPTPQFELRNAISARKIEECVAPELRQILGRKPRLLLVYGAGHSGLKEDLQNPALRDAYIGMYSAMGFPGIDTTYLDTVTNLSIDQNGQYSLQHRKAGLFKD